jgi:hypothetical protein
MSDSITQIWSGLREAGMPEVMLFMPDGTASRSHWDETAMIGSMRVALLGDQERKIVRVIPVDACIGIGVATPKGIDTSCFRAMVQTKLTDRFPRAAAAARSPVPVPTPGPAAINVRAVLAAANAAAAVPGAVPVGHGLNPAVPRGGHP